MAGGTGRIIEGDEANEINGRLRSKYLTPKARDGLGSAWGSVDDVAVEITPHKWRSWSSEALTKMSQEAAGNLAPDQVAGARGLTNSTSVETGNYIPGCGCQSWIRLPSGSQQWPNRPLTSSKTSSPASTPDAFSCFNMASRSLTR